MTEARSSFLAGSAAFVSVSNWPLALYIVNSLSPWARGLFEYRDHAFFLPFWTSIAVLHWSSTMVVLALLKRAGGRSADIGLGMWEEGKAEPLRLSQAGGWIEHESLARRRDAGEQAAAAHERDDDRQYERIARRPDRHVARGTAPASATGWRGSRTRSAALAPMAPNRITRLRAAR